MHRAGSVLRVSATDVGWHLAWRHRTTLERRLAEGRIEAPQGRDPMADLLAERGLAHERGLPRVPAVGVRDHRDRDRRGPGAGRGARAHSREKRRPAESACGWAPPTGGPTPRWSRRSAASRGGKRSTSSRCPGSARKGWTSERLPSRSRPSASSPAATWRRCISPPVTWAARCPRWAGCCSSARTASGTSRMPGVAKAIGLTPRATRTRLARFVGRGLVREIGAGPQDPKRR